MREDVEIYTTLWKIKELPWALFFSWGLFKNKVPTLDNLVYRGSPLHTYTCVMCANLPEYIM